MIGFSTHPLLQLLLTVLPRRSHWCNVPQRTNSKNSNKTPVLWWLPQTSVICEAQRPPRLACPLLDVAFPWFTWFSSMIDCCLSIFLPHLGIAQKPRKKEHFQTRHDRTMLDLNNDLVKVCYPKSSAKSCAGWMQTWKTMNGWKSDTTLKHNNTNRHLSVWRKKERKDVQNAPFNHCTHTHIVTRSQSKKKTIYSKWRIYSSQQINFHNILSKTVNKVYFAPFSHNAHSKRECQYFITKFNANMFTPFWADKCDARRTEILPLPMEGNNTWYQTILMDKWHQISKFIT